MPQSLRDSCLCALATAEKSAPGFFLPMSLRLTPPTFAVGIATVTEKLLHTFQTLPLPLPWQQQHRRITYTLHHDLDSWASCVIFDLLHTAEPRRISHTAHQRASLGRFLHHHFQITKQDPKDYKCITEGSHTSRAAFAMNYVLKLLWCMRGLVRYLGC